MKASRRRYPPAILALVAWCVLTVGTIGLAVSEESPSADPPEPIQERGVTPGNFGQLNRQYQRKQPLPPPAGPPANLCHAQTIMMTQCKCFNLAECQQLTALFPNSCPTGSAHCEFTPMSRGPMPPLPPNLCGYQVPLTITECTCSNAAECQLLSPFCPGACPTGSQSCTCRPLQRR